MSDKNNNEKNNNENNSNNDENNGNINTAAASITAAAITTKMGVKGLLYYCSQHIGQVSHVVDLIELVII